MQAGQAGASTCLKRTDVDTQWRKMMRLLGVDVTFALSPQAKGKVERPYRWLQDRIIRTCALEKLSTLEEIRPVLREEVDRYNNHQVHSTTKEIPAARFAKAIAAGNSPHSSAVDSRRGSQPGRFGASKRACMPSCATLPQSAPSGSSKPCRSSPTAKRRATKL